jgi:hypothetical protein
MSGNDGLKIMTQLINKKYETGEWSMNFNEITKTALKEAKRWKIQRPIAHIAHIVARILKRRKIEEVLGEDRLGFRRGKGSRDAMGMLRII